MKRLHRLLMVACVLLAPIASADAPHQLMWEDLVPKLQASENPFSKLTKEQLSRLSEVAATRDRKARADGTLTAPELENEQVLARKLQQSGIDVDGLLAKRKEMAEQQRLRGQALNSTLNGQLVRLPGYLLPLEFSGKLVTEFLLVPWVGACIHTPPPPPNQIVHVKTDKPFEMAGIFMPVWVTGQMVAASTKKSLFLIDGSSDIDIGYSLQASQVEPYRE
ncbi:MAG TPA: DUF3299 domain-containing protein [Burkholderiales bacterium]|nr:DUF3299 domain-containing protein [Burkholderiales bacterium]